MAEKKITTVPCSSPLGDNCNYICHKYDIEVMVLQFCYIVAIDS